MVLTLSPRATECVLILTRRLCFDNFFKTLSFIRARYYCFRVDCPVSLTVGQMFLLVVNERSLLDDRIHK